MLETCAGLSDSVSAAVVVAFIDRTHTYLSLIGVRVRVRVRVKV